MKGTWEIIKKIGAAIIVLLLVLMMAITFSSQPMDEIISLLSGSSKVGSFNGEPILVKDYSFIYNECENQFQKYGFTEIPPFLLQNCIFENVQSLYVKPVIADELGIDISKESVEKQIIDYVKEIHRLQKKNNLPEDVIPIEQLYQRELRAFPIYKRIAFSRSAILDSFLGNPIPLSDKDWQTIQKIGGDSIYLQVKFLTFNNQDLLKTISVEVTQEEIRAQYEKDKKEFISKKENQGKSYPLLQERKKFIREKLEKEKKRKKLSEIKGTLSEINRKSIHSFEELIKIIKISPIEKRISLKNIDSILISKEKKISLNHNEFLSALISGQQDKIIGPIQDKENTIYVQVIKIVISNTSKNLEIDVERKKLEERLAYVFYQYILEQYRKRGDFQLYNLTNKEKKKK